MSLVPRILDTASAPTHQTVQSLRSAAGGKKVPEAAGRMHVDQTTAQHIYQSPYDKRAIGEVFLDRNSSARTVAMVGQPCGS